MCVTYYSRVDGVEGLLFFAQELAARKALAASGCAILCCCGMSTALRVGGVAALALVPVAVVLTVWLLRV